MQRRFRLESLVQALRGEPAAICARRALGTLAAQSDAVGNEHEVRTPGPLGRALGRLVGDVADNLLHRVLQARVVLLLLFEDEVAALTVTVPRAAREVDSRVVVREVCTDGPTWSFESRSRHPRGRRTEVAKLLDQLLDVGRIGVLLLGDLERLLLRAHLARAKVVRLGLRCPTLVE